MPKNTKAKHLQARVAFLESAATHLANQQFCAPEEPSATEHVGSSSPYTGLPLLLASHMRTVAKRGVLRIDAKTKRSFCRVCSTPLLEGKTCITRVENASKQRKKPWADVETITCLNCGTKKRFPIGAQRQTKKSQRFTNNTGTAGSASGLQPIDESANATLDAVNTKGKG